MDFEDFENFLQLRRQDAHIWDDPVQNSPKGGELNSATGKSFQINPSEFPSLETAKQCPEGVNKDLSAVKKKETWEEHGEDKKGSWTAKTIIFTKFGKDIEDDPEGWLRNMSKQCDWVFGQLECCPNTRRMHIQGMAYNKTPLRWGWLKGDHNWKRTCFSPLKSIEYCSKSDTKVQGPWEFGERPTWNIKGEKQKRLTNQEILNGDLIRMVDEERLGWRDYEKAKKFKACFIADKTITKNKEIVHNMEHEWIVGPTGCGKTTYARGQGPSYLKGKNKWWDNYKGQDNVIIEDFGKSDVWLGDRLKEWADKWPFVAEVKNGQLDEIRPKKVMVTSNYRIEDLWEDLNVVDPLLRRFKVKELP